MKTPKRKPLKFSEPMEVLPQKTRDYAEKLIPNTKLATEFLQRAGMITKTDRLGKHYR
jgi:hypothetical protein